MKASTDMSPTHHTHTPVSNGPSGVGGKGEDPRTVCVDDVQRGADGADDHAGHLEGEEEVRPEPAVAADLGGGDAEAVQTRAAADELGDDEDDAELRLVDALVPFRHVARGPVREQARHGEAEDGADKGAGVHVARLDLVEEEGRAEEDGGEDDADEHRPPDQHALNQGGPEDGRVQEEGKGAEKQLEEGLRRLAPVEG